jgi:hypothetical protein
MFHHFLAIRVINQGRDHSDFYFDVEAMNQEAVDSTD